MRASNETGADTKRPTMKARRPARLIRTSSRQSTNRVHLYPCVMRWLSFRAWIGPSPRSMTRKPEKEASGEDDAKMSRGTPTSETASRPMATREKQAGRATIMSESRQAEIFPERVRMPKRGKLDRLGMVVGGEPEGRNAHADKRASERRPKPREMRDPTRAAERRIDCTAETLDHALGNGNEHKRADKKPRALLERLPAEAEGGT